MSGMSGKLTTRLRGATTTRRTSQRVGNVRDRDVGTLLSDAETLQFYDDNARSYVAARPHELSSRLMAFLPRLQAGAVILELGCGSGNNAAEMERLGFRVEATDGSASMAAIASETLGRQVKVLRFGDLSALDKYDAVVACASLLHVPREGLPQVLRRIWTSLKPGGWHFASFKTGGRPAHDEHGRYYNYPDRAFAEAAYHSAGGWQSMCFESYDGVGYFSAPARWLTVTVQKVS